MHDISHTPSSTTNLSSESFSHPSGHVKYRLLTIVPFSLAMNPNGMSADDTAESDSDCSGRRRSTGGREMGGVIGLDILTPFFVRCDRGVGPTELSEVGSYYSTFLTIKLCRTPVWAGRTHSGLLETQCSTSLADVLFVAL